MSYTLADLRNRVVNDKLDDPSFDGPTVDRFINDTQRDIFNTYELPFMEKTFEGLLPTGQRIFQFPDDCQLVQTATITTPDGQQKNIMNGYIDFRTFTQKFPTPSNSIAGSVQYWTSYAGKLYTSAPTDVPYTLEIFYIKKPKELVDNTSVPEIPEEFQEVLILGAFKRVLERNEDFDLAGVIGNQYNDQLDKMVARYGYRMSNGPTIIKQPRLANVRRR